MMAYLSASITCQGRERRYDRGITRQGYSDLLMTMLLEGASMTC